MDTSIAACGPHAGGISARHHPGGGRGKAAAAQGEGGARGAATAGAQRTTMESAKMATAMIHTQ